MAEAFILGRPLPRFDALDKARGSALYVSDLKFPRMLWGKVLRSRYPHARILRVDVTRAKRVPGVRAIITGEDTPKRRFGPIIPDEYVLAGDKVRYIGDEVAAVAAESEEAAEEALELIDVDYEELPAVFDPEEAMADGAPKIHEKGNIAFHFQYERGDAGEGFKESDYIFEGRFVTQMNHQGYMETRGCLAVPDPSGKVTIWGGFQNIFHIRRQTAAALAMPESKIRVIQPPVGGGFGGKTTSSEAPISALLALKTGRPVKLINSRTEDFQAGRPRVPHIIEERVGVKRDGTLIVQDVKVISDCGAYADHAPGTSEVAAMRHGCMYRFAHMRGEGFVVYTNKTPTGACRGFGNPEGTFALEQLMDEIAEGLGIDPLELRLKNAVGPNYTTPHGWKITSCGLKECLERVAEVSGWREKRAQSARGRGVGMACGIHVCGNRIAFDYDGSGAMVRLEEDGKVTLITGEGDTGQGAWPVLAQIVSQELGVPPQDVTVALPDTDVSPFCMGAYASRVTFIGGNAVRMAAADAKRQLFEVASGLLEASPQDLETKEGRVYVKGTPDRFVTFAQAGKAAIYRRGGNIIIGRGNYDPPTEQMDKKTLMGNFSPSYTFAAQVAEVEVDPETGEVRVVNFFSADDVGRAINPLNVEGQVEGAISQGIGLALMEEMVWDGGNLTNGNLMDYRMPCAPEVPGVKSLIIETIDPEGPYGAKSSSECSIVPVPAAIANAIYHAVGVRVRSLPITPEKILRGLREKAS